MQPAKRLDERAVNQMLMSNGLGKLDDPGLIPQLGFLVSHVVRSHEQFRELVNRCEPSTRPLMYEALKPYVRAFEPRPLDVYIAELADLAERKQLPIVNADGTLSEYKVPEIQSDNWAGAPKCPKCDGVLYASNLPHDCRAAVLKSENTDEAHAAELVEFAAAQKFLTLTCRSCTRFENFAGWNKDAAVAKARAAGWRAVNSVARQEEAEICPTCVEKYWPSLKDARPI